MRGWVITPAGLGGGGSKGDGGVSERCSEPSGDGCTAVHSGAVTGLAVTDLAPPMRRPVRGRFGQGRAAEACSGRNWGQRCGCQAAWDLRWYAGAAYALPTRRRRLARECTVLTRNVLSLTLHGRQWAHSLFTQNSCCVRSRDPRGARLCCAHASQCVYRQGYESLMRTPTLLLPVAHP